MNFPGSIHAARELIRVKTAGNEFVTMVHEATNEDPWGPTGPQMDTVCRAFPRGSVDIMEEIRLRLKNRDKSWRSCYKTLLLLDYLARNAPESTLPYICSLVSTLRVISQSFYYTGSKGVDHGLSVRERAKKLVDLLGDGVALREEREKASQTRAKLSGVTSVCGGGRYGQSSSYNQYEGFGGGGRSSPPASNSYDPYVSRSTAVPRTREEQEQLDMQLAMKMQRDEENRTGINTIDAERAFSQRARNRVPSDRSTALADADMELARRLQEEQQRRSDSGGGATPPASASALSPPAAPKEAKIETPKTQAPKAEPPKPDHNMLDDLFAPAPVQASAPPPSSFDYSRSAPASQPQPSLDPFDAFLDTRMQHQQQQPQPQGASMMPPQQQQQMLYGGVPQQQQQQQTQQPEFGGWLTGMPMQMQQSMQTPMQQPFGMGMQMPMQQPYGMGMQMPMQQPYGMGMPPQQQQMQQQVQQPQWGMQATTGNYYAGGGMPQGGMTGAPVGGNVNSSNFMEQQFASAFGSNQTNSKSLDALMAERHGSS